MPRNILGSSLARRFAAPAAFLIVAASPVLAQSAQEPAAPAQVTPQPAPPPAPTPAPSGPAVQGPPDGVIAPGPAPRFTFPAPSAATPPVQTPVPSANGTVPPDAAQPVRRAPPAAANQIGPRNGSGAAAVPAGPASPASETSTPTDAQSIPPSDAAPLPTPNADAVPQETSPLGVSSLVEQWGPLVAGGLGLVLLALAVLWLRRGRKTRNVLDDDAAPIAVVPPPAPAPTSAPTSAPTPAPTPAAAPARPVLGKRAELSVDLEPLVASSSLVRFRLRYAVTLTNSGGSDAADIVVRLGLFAGTTANQFGISQWFLGQDGMIDQRIDTLKAGDSYRFEGEVAAPIEAIAPVPIDGRMLAIPIIGVDARYHHPAHESPIDAQSARAFVVGTAAANGDGRLGPLPLDRGPAEFAGLARRDTGISQIS